MMVESQSERIARSNEKNWRLLIAQHFPLPRPDMTSAEGQRLETYLASLRELPPAPGSGHGSIPDQRRLAEVGDMLDATLAFRGTDGSRIQPEEVKESLDLLRWETCKYCDGQHPVVLILRDRVVQGEHVLCEGVVDSQIIICDSGPFITHIHGK